MMRGPKMTAMAVRDPQGEIVIEKFPTESAARGKFFRLPIIRGLFGYIDTMKFGSKCLMRSAEISGLDEAEEELEREKREKRLEKAKKNPKKAEKIAKKQAKEDKKKEELVQKATAKYNEAEALRATLAENLDAARQSLESARESGGDTSAIEKEVEALERDLRKAEARADKAKKAIKNPSTSALMALITSISMVLGVVIAVGLFVMLPTFLYGLAAKHIGFLNPENPTARSFVKSVFEGILKVLILVGYMGAVSLMKDIRRTFMFHGAEHMTIFCYEAGLELTVENVRKQKRFHPRCGTSFLILMVLVSIFVSFFIDPLLSLVGITEATVKFYMLIRVSLKILLLPLIVGLGYELIKIAGRYDNILTKIISAPGVWLQHITVFKPTDDMIECAIAAVKEVIPDDGSDKW